jgi:hypothetical protein
VGPGAYFAPTLAGKRCISEVAPINLCFRIKHYKCLGLAQTVNGIPVYVYIRRINRMYIRVFRIFRINSVYLKFRLSQILI